MINLGLPFMLLYISLLCLAIWHFRVFQLNGIPKSYVIGAFLLKILAAYVMVLVYTYIYPKRDEADIFKFFDDSIYIHQLFFTHPIYYFQIITGIYIDPEALKPYLQEMHWWYKPIYHDAYNEARIMIRINAILRIFSGGYYLTHAVFVSFLSLIGSINIYKLGLRLSAQNKNTLLLGIIFLLPSIVFWCSGVLKEGLVLFIIGGLLYHSYQLSVSSYSGKKLLYVIGYMLLLIITKPFLITCFIPGLITLVIIKQFNTQQFSKKKILATYGAINLLCLLIFFNLHHFGHSFDLVYKLCYKRGEYIYFAEHIGAGSLLYNNYLHFHWWEVLREAPIALFHSILSPLPWKAYSLFTFVASFENLLFVGICIYLFIKSSPYNHPIEKNFQLSTFNFQLLILNFLLYVLILIGITTPIAGSLVRYKAPFMPILLILIIGLQSSFTKKINS